MSRYFTEPKSSGGRVKVEIDLSNYATKIDLKNGISVHTSKFAGKVDLASLKSEVDKLEEVLTGLNSLKSTEGKLNVGKLVPVPFDLSKLSDVVKNDIVKKDIYNAKIKDIEDKIPYLTNLATNTTLNAKVNEVKKGIPSFSNLVTNASLNAKINGLKTKYLTLLIWLLLLLLLSLKIKCLIIVNTSLLQNLIS